MTEALDAKTGARTPAVVDGRDYETGHNTVAWRDSSARLAQIVGRLLPERGSPRRCGSASHLVAIISSWRAASISGRLGSLVQWRAHQRRDRPAGRHPDRTIVVVAATVAYSLAGFELMTAVEHELPVDLDYLQ